VCVRGIYKWMLKEYIVHFYLPDEYYVMLLAVYNAVAVICRRTDTVAIHWGWAFARPSFSAVKYWVRRKVTSTDVAMVRILNVAEKNDAAKSLSDIMSAGRYTKVTVLWFLFSS